MYSVTIKSDKPLVTISLEEYESLKETIELLSDKQLARDIRQARRELAEGKTTD